MRHSARQRHTVTPKRFWLVLVAFLGIFLGALIAATVILDAPGSLKAAAGVTVAWIALPVIALLLMTLFWPLRRSILLGAGLLALPLYLVAYPSTLALGPAWPVNVWRDLLADDLIVFDFVQAKRIERHTHSRCVSYYSSYSGGSYTSYCNGREDYNEDHHWIRFGGREWSVSGGLYSVLREGELVEMAYKPRTKLLLYVAYGPNVGRARSANEVRVAVALDASEREVFASTILPRFKDSTGIDITFVQLEPGTLIDVLYQELGSPFDLLAVDNNQLGRLVELDLVQDLTGEVGRVPPEVLPSMLPVTRFGDKTFFLPFRPNVTIAYYNESQMKRAGFAPPRSWEDLYAVAKGLVEDGHGRRVVLKGYPGAANAVQITEFLWQAGGDPLVLNDEGSRTAFTFLQELYPYLSELTKDAKHDTTNEYLISEQAYLAPNWTFGISEVVVKAGKRDIKAYSGWRGPEGEFHVLGGNVVAIPNRSKNRDNALQFAEYLMSKEVQSVLARELSWPSIRIDAYDGIDPELRPYWDAINEAMSKAKARPNVAYWPEVEQILTRAWNDIVVGGMDVNSRLDYYAGEVDAARSGGASVPQRLGSTAPPAGTGGAAPQTGASAPRPPPPPTPVPPPATPAPPPPAAPAPPALAYAPLVQVVWMRRFGSSGDDGATSVAVDAEGNVYVGGWTGYDAFLRKFGPGREAIWNREFGCKGRARIEDVALDDQGNVYVAGWANCPLSGQPSRSGWGAFLRQYSSSGEELWTRQFGQHTGRIDFPKATSLAVDSEGNVYVGGSGRPSLFPLKFDAEGNELWSSPLAWSRDVAVDAAGNLLAAGQLIESGSGRPDRSFVLRKHDSSGVELWSRKIDSKGGDSRMRIAVDSEGNVYAAGRTGNDYGAGQAESFFRKYGPSGSELWSHRVDSNRFDWVMDMGVDSEGNVYVIGRTLQSHMVLRKYSASGEEQWVRRLGATTHSASSVLVNTSGNVYVAGSTGGLDAFVALVVRGERNPVAAPQSGASVRATPTPIPTPVPTSTP